MITTQKLKALGFKQNMIFKNFFSFTNCSFDFIFLDNKLFVGMDLINCPSNYDCFLDDIEHIQWFVQKISISSNKLQLSVTSDQ